MALGLTPEHLELAAAVRGWAERHCPVDVPRAASGQPDGGGQQYRDTLGPSLAAQGVLGLHVPEKHGGQGYGLPELAVAIEELGRALLPGAFLPTVWASAVLAAVVGPTSSDDPADPASPADRSRGVGGTGGADPTNPTNPAGHSRGASVAAGTAGVDASDEVFGTLAGLADGSLHGAATLAAGLTG